MSDAPEKLFRTLTYNKATKRACIMVFPSQIKAERDGAAGAEIAEYIRADVAQAMVAKAREDALIEAESAVSELRMQNQGIVMQWNEAIDLASERIEALIPTAEGEA